MNSFPILQEYMKSSRAGRFEEQHFYINILSSPYMKPFQPDRILLLYAKRSLLQNFQTAFKPLSRKNILKSENSSIILIFIKTIISLEDS